MSHRHLEVFLSCVGILLSACPGPSPRPEDGGAEGDADRGSDADGDGDADIDADEGTDAEVDGDHPTGDPRPGPLTLVATQMHLVEDRVCDFDGDGFFDNCIADLGGSGAMVFLAGINSQVAGNITEGLRILAHVPWVDDLRGPDDLDGAVLFVKGLDVDSPPDLTDDMSGVEPFYAEWRSLDGCGEPLYGLADATLDGGELVATGGSVPFPLTPSTWLPGREAQVSGSIAPDGATGEVVICGLALIGELGAIDASGFAPGLTMLELLLAGGAAIGLPAFDGVSPDVDRDGDGLERFVRDDEQHIVSCIDGDYTVLDGRDCWADPRMADGFSITATVQLVGATFAGREPGWEEIMEGRCDDPPEESLFEPR